MYNSDHKKQTGNIYLTHDLKIRSTTVRRELYKQIKVQFLCGCLLVGTTEGESLVFYLDHCFHYVGNIRVLSCRTLLNVERLVQSIG